MEYTDGAFDRKLIVSIGDKLYSLPVSNVERVLFLRADAISEVPHDPTGRIRGIFNDRGTVTAIARVKGLEAWSDANGNEEMTCVILRDGDRRFGILVDRAEEVAQRSIGSDAVLLDVHSLYLGVNNGDYQ